MKRYYFDVTEEQERNIALVFSMMKSEFGIEVNELKSRRSSRFSTPVGVGFGDCVWRVNYNADRIEASFARPCWQSKAVKSAGFKWNHECGIWYAENTQTNAEACGILKLVQVESIPKV